jgi:hypothetical protein
MGSTPFLRLAMKKLLPLWICVFIGILSFPVSGHPESSYHSDTGLHADTYAFINGQWFNGEKFIPKTMYSKNGMFTHSTPEQILKTFDLKNGFVVPPFGEAHTHNVEGLWNIDTVIKNYLRDGIFYVKNPNDISEFVKKIRHRLNTPASIDVTFAHAGLTGPNGHPINLYEDMLRIHRYEPVIGKRDKGWFEGRAYFPITNVKDLQERWLAITRTKPDFLKIYLGDSEHFHTNNTGDHHGFRKGLDPTLVDTIVTMAHQQELRVSAHVETAEDFRTAILGQVDEIVHLPGWFLPSSAHRAAVQLTQEDAQLAAKHQVVVVTTTVAEHFHPTQHSHAHSGTHLQEASSPQSDHQQAPAHNISDMAKIIQANNLTLLHQAGVKIAIGSDHAETALAEALNLYQLDIFDNLTLLKMWSETTPQTIFPSRKIGRLEEGYEASFLVLTGNPLEDFRNVGTITHRFKQGVELSESSAKS